MMGTKARIFNPIAALTLDDLVPTEHFYRQLDRALDLSFVRNLVRDCYAPGGRPSIDPVVFFKLGSPLGMVMFFEGIRSERQLVTVAADRLSVRWYLGYDLGERLPNHSGHPLGVTRIRERYGLPIFQRFFEHVLVLCQEAGLISGHEFIFDATKIAANASLDSLMPRFAWQARLHLDELFDAGPATPLDEQDPPPQVRDLPTSLSATDHDGLATENRDRWRLLEHYRLDPERPSTGGRTRVTDLKVSPTDPDAALMKQRGRVALGYHNHYVVDGGPGRIILAALVTPADVMENTPLPDLLWRTCFRWRLQPQQVVADTTYGTGENIRLLEEAGIRAYVPLADYERSSRFFRQRDFSYDAEQDAYTCPAGATLHFRGNNYSTRVRIYQAPTIECQTCELRSQCTTSKEGRKLNRHFDEEYRERVRSYHGTPAYRRASRKRKVWIEPLFGEAKQWHGLRQFRLRGLQRVNREALLVATGQNLKRLLSWRGWGRRPFPGGAAGMRLPVLGPLHPYL